MSAIQKFQTTIKDMLKLAPVKEEAEEVVEEDANVTADGEGIVFAQLGKVAI